MLLELVLYAKENGQGEKRSEDNIHENTVIWRIENEKSTKETEEKRLEITHERI